MKLYLFVDEEEYYETEPNPEDRWDSGTRALRIRGVGVGKGGEHDWEVPVEPGETFVALVEHWLDGDTFGSYEQTEIKGCFPDEVEARKYAATLKVNHGYFGSHLNFLCFDVVAPQF